MSYSYIVNAYFDSYIIQPPYVVPHNPVIPQPFVPPVQNPTQCQGQAQCINGIVTSITDGDTLQVNGVPIRLTLVNTPEPNEPRYAEAKAFVESVCVVGTRALVDEDDGQPEGSFERLIGLVYCGGTGISLNELLLLQGYAEIILAYCDKSEFSTTPWAQMYGCGQL
jgi:micrococcal nuclease